MGLFKIELGSSMLLGLETLVLADVIETITATLSFRSLAFLVSIVVLQTIFSWTLALEIEGLWPWQSPDEGQGSA